jgi:tripartite-type tricarboxylate transporter receptor subunit TctC
MKPMQSLMLAFLVLAGATGAAQAQAAQYPSRTVKVLVPYNPGGATDIVARIVLDQMRNILGQAFIVENKPAAYGIVALEETARAKPDGYTLMIGNISTNALTPLLHKAQLHIDYAKDIEPITELAVIPNFALATKSFPADSLATMIAYVKAHPGQVKYASAGVGSYPHIDMLMLMREAGLDEIHVPFSGGAGGALLTDLLKGDVQLGFLNVATFGPEVRAGRLQAFAVTSSQRQAKFPDVPTMTELGYKGIGSENWQGLFGPAQLPPEVVARLRGAVVAALQSDKVKSVFAESDIIADSGGSQAQFAGFTQHEMDRFSATIAEAHLVVE